MKKMLVAMIAALVASTASATIKNSSHDFTATGNRYGGGGSTCAYCHMPHFAAAVSGAPLWSRNVSTTGYTYYVSNVAGAQNATGALDGASGICLSCHDGTQAVSTILKMGNGVTGNTTVPGSTGTATLATATASTALIGTNLQNDHPISITYTTSNGNPGGLTTTVPAVFGITTPGTSRLNCTSCHNAHNDAYSKTAAQGASGYPNRQFMVAYSTSTDFCGACHAAK